MAGIMRVIAIDPGQWSGVAVFDDGSLIHAELVGKGQDAVVAWTQEIILYTHGVQGLIEIPQVYRQRQQKGDPNDLISVAYIAGMFGGWLQRGGAQVQLVKPHVWKGSRPKDIDIKYTWSCLSESERALLPKLPKSKLHNVLDAVGIGLWHLRRR